MKNEAEGRNLRLEATILKLVSQVLAEIGAPMTYYVVDKICDKFNLPVPSLSQVMTELSKAGHQAVATHFNKKGIRTDAQASEVRAIIDKLTET
jgi:tRNA G26 N,N-dimethylase Trm1